MKRHRHIHIPPDSDKEQNSKLIKYVNLSNLIAKNHFHANALHPSSVYSVTAEFVPLSPFPFLLFFPSSPQCNRVQRHINFFLRQNEISLCQRTRDGRADGNRPRSHREINLGFYSSNWICIFQMTWFQSERRRCALCDFRHYFAIVVLEIPNDVRWERLNARNCHRRVSALAHTHTHVRKSTFAMQKMRTESCSENCSRMILTHACARTYWRIENFYCRIIPNEEWMI